MNSERITFLGTGLMGRPMASRLARAGIDLTVWNRTAAKADTLREAGARPEPDLVVACSGATIVISMLEAGPAVQETLERALPVLPQGALWIDMSSTSHADALILHERALAAGVNFLDAPVSGGVAGAEAGSLAIMAGGAPDDFARAEPILQLLGRPTLVGPAGSGQIAKLCNQLIVGGTLNIIAEALLLAQAAGADPAAVRHALRGGFAESRLLEVHGQRMLERNFVPGGQVKSQLKDLRNVLAAAADAGLVLPVASLVTDTYAGIEHDFAQADQAAALLAVEKLNAGQRVGSAPDQLP